MLMLLLVPEVGGGGVVLNSPIWPIQGCAGG